MTARVLIVAGSDSGGGAGIQADIRTVTMLGGHAMTAVTAITAQNTLGVHAVHAVPADVVVAQMRACIDDIGVDAVKIGMIGCAATAHAVADVLEGLYPGGGRGPAAMDEWVRATPASPILGPGLRRGTGKGIPIVFDPVMVATSGSVLADAETIAAFGRLMALASVVTPNLPELVALGGEAAVRESGAAVLVKGGHGAGDVIEDRLVAADGVVTRWRDARIETTSTHGTGCTLASGIAEGLGRGMALADAVARARTFVRMALREVPGLGGGHGPMGHQAVRLDCDLGGAIGNQVTVALDDYGASRDFYGRLGLRQIVDAAPRYARFESVGGTTLSIEARGEMAGGPVVYFECGDLDGVVARLRAAGVAVSDARDERWGWREARCVDPAGNAVCLYRAGETRRFPEWRSP